MCCDTPPENKDGHVHMLVRTDDASVEWGEGGGSYWVLGVPLWARRKDGLTCLLGVWSVGPPKGSSRCLRGPGAFPVGSWKGPWGGGKGGKGGVLVAMCVNPETCSKRTTPKLLGAEDLLMAPIRATGKLKNGRGLAPPAQTLEYNCWTARRIPGPKILNLLVA